MTWEFDCLDCGASVVSFFEPSSQRCAGCIWLAQTPFATPEERAEMRRVMLARGVIGRQD